MNREKKRLTRQEKKERFRTIASWLRFKKEKARIQEARELNKEFNY